MKTMKFNFLLLLAVIAPLFVACESSDDEPTVPNVPIGNGVLVLNQGKFGNNNASLTYQDKDSKSVTTDVFSINNQRNLGDTGQDILLYGSKIYIAVYNSSVLEVMDAKTGVSKKVIPLINDAGAPRSPRSLASYNGKVFITLYDGHVAQIDTTSLVVEKTIAVGPNPEGIVVANNKLYVAISGGMAAINDSTVTVIDPSTFTKLRDIKVVVNPDRLIADSQGDVYVISNGNYGYETPAIYYTLQRIEAGTDKVTAITGYTPQKMAIYNDQLYFYSFDSDYSTYMASNKKFVQYNAATESVVNENFITNDPTSKLLYSLDVDPKNGDIYMSETDFKNDGKMYVFTNDGVSKSTFAVGLNASKTIFTSTK